MAPNRTCTNAFTGTDSACTYPQKSSPKLIEGNDLAPSNGMLLDRSGVAKTSKSNTVGVFKDLMPSSGPDEKDGGNRENRESDQTNQWSSSGSGGREEKRNIPPGLSKGHPKCTEEEMKNESKRVETFRGSCWPHSFLSPKVMAEAGFYFLKDDVVRCPFCKIEIGLWEEGDIPRKEHKRWSGNCPYIRGLQCGNVPIRDNDASASASEVHSEDNSMLSYDVCGIHEEMRPFSFCDDETSRASASSSSVTCLRSKLTGSDNGGAGELPKPSLERLGVRDIRAPVHPEYCSDAARLATYLSWPLAIKQRPKDLSDAGFYYTGNGDQTICFHCGGGLRDWEEGDDPWVEHAKWFSKCHFLNLVKGSDFISQVTQTRPALITAEEVRSLANPCPIAAGSETASASAPAVQGCENTAKSSSSSTSTKTVETAEKTEETNEIKDDGRLCKICYSAELGVVFLPCGHMVACVRCAPSLSVCPVCRQPFSHTVRAFLS